MLTEISYGRTNQSNRRNIAELAKRYPIWPDQSLQNQNNPRTMQNLPEKYTVQVPKMQGLIIFRQRCTLFRFVSWKLVTSGHLWAMFSKCGFLTLFSRKWLTLIFEFVNFLLVFKNILWCIYKFSPSENKFDNFNNILAKSAHLWLLLITFIKLIKR